MNHTETRLAVLDRLYQLHRELTRTMDHCCQRECNVCCTCNVTLTTLEGEYLLRSLEKIGSTGPQASPWVTSPDSRYRPRLTINALAACCARGEEPPHEENDPQWGTCLLLAEGLCTIYAARPFVCRAMLSRVPCHQTGTAEIEPLAMTINHLLAQYIEHIDAYGYTGNLVDIMHWLQIPNNRTVYTLGRRTAVPAEGLLANQPATVLMIPPEHRRQVEPILNRIHHLRV
jgi:hypothetical protein